MLAWWWHSRWVAGYLSGRKLKNWHSIRNPIYPLAPMWASSWFSPPSTPQWPQGHAARLYMRQNLQYLRLYDTHHWRGPSLCRPPQYFYPVVWACSVEYFPQFSPIHICHLPCPWLIWILPYHCWCLRLLQYPCRPCLPPSPPPPLSSPCTSNLLWLLHLTPFQSYDHLTKVICHTLVHWTIHA